MEHAAAVAGGSLGTIAGKPLAKGMMKVLGGVDQASGKPAKAPHETSEIFVAKRVTPVQDAGFAASPAASAPAAALKFRKRASRRVEAVRAEQPASTPVVAMGLPPRVAARILTLQDFAVIQPGIQSPELLAALGQPASMVTIPDEGHLTQILRYVSGKRWVGTVKMENGTVVQVETAP